MTLDTKRKRGASSHVEERKRAALLAVERHDRVARAYGHDAASACRSVDLGEGLEATGGVTWRKLSTQDRQRLLDLTDGNMSGHYGHKWEEERTGKRKDMASRESRYIVVRSKCDASIAGFCNYRFLVEDDEWVVLYVYELQVREAHRSKGIGRALVEMSTLLARQTGMQGVMLTTLKANEGACRFYKREGFTPSTMDPGVVSPERAEDFDYRILVKLFPKESP